MSSTFVGAEVVAEAPVHLAVDDEGQEAEAGVLGNMRRSFGEYSNSFCHPRHLSPSQDPSGARIS